MHHLDLFGGVEVRSARKESTEERSENAEQVLALYLTSIAQGGSPSLQQFSVPLHRPWRIFSTGTFSLQQSAPRQQFSRSHHEARASAIKEGRLSAGPSCPLQPNTVTTRMLSSVGEPSRSGVTGGRCRPDFDSHNKCKWQRSMPRAKPSGNTQRTATSCRAMPSSASQTSQHCKFACSEV